MVHYANHLFQCQNISLEMEVFQKLANLQRKLHLALELSVGQSKTAAKVENQVSNHSIQNSIVSLIKNQATFEGGRWRFFRDAWLRLTGDQFILYVISNCHIDFETEPYNNTSSVKRPVLAHFHFI